MSIFRTSLPHSGKSPSTTMTLLLKAFCQRLGQAFQARGMLQLGMLDGIVATLEENARKDRLRALYPTSTTFGSFADGPTATAMQPPTTHPRYTAAALRCNGHKASPSVGLIKQRLRLKNDT
ncbi:hypothetical protein NKW53_03450 [Acetobacter orientalis]|uniref:hypothetical protein n=2 Tax=Acetobacter orientalis TaxID=146474 RepID=UPI0020A1B95B|nr:hypothetical protein [Acetobacter orientalis]MCP1215127.1 hypothetical protein [Acetobacter orientalis]MCP1218710.1 hypothetical protein [Acetobacter orientalis]